MVSINMAMIGGNLGHDPRRIEFEGGRFIVTFSVATNESYTTKDGEVIDRTEWHDVTVYGPKLAALVLQYLRKGSSVFVVGKNETRAFISADGTKNRKTVVAVRGYGHRIEFLDGAAVAELAALRESGLLMDPYPEEIDEVDFAHAG